MKFKFASFNVENLFARPKVFLMDDYSKGDVILGKIRELAKHIGKTTYNAATKKAILKLYKETKVYVEVIESHQKLMNRAKTKVTASGRGSWLGYLKLKKRKFDDKTVKNTAQVLKDVNADVCCLVEVENRPVLDAFSRQRLKWTKKKKKQSYGHNMLVDGNDQRGIDVGLLSKRPIRSVWSHIDDKKGRSRIFSRDCPEMEVALPGGKALWVLLNHLKSKGYGSQDTSDKRRKGQAQRIKKLLSSYDLKKDYVIVAGDLNDTPGSKPLKPLLGIKDLHDVLETVPANDRWTYHYRKNQQIDYVLVSTPLNKKLKSAGVFRRGIHDLHKHTVTGEKQYKKVTSFANAASDHGCVWAEFDL